MLELDAAGLEAAQHAREAQKRADGSSRYKPGLELLSVNLLKRVQEGTLGPHLRALQQLATNDALFADPDCFVAVLEAAEKVGAEVVAADRDAVTTRKRMDLAQVFATMSPRKADGGEVIKRMGPAVVKALTASHSETMRRHDCLMPREEMMSAARGLIFDAAVYGRVRHENLAAVRACIGAHNDKFRDYELLLAAPAVRMAGGTPPSVAAVASTAQDPSVRNAIPAKFAERELLFARALQSNNASGRDVVGVFLPKHISGIARQWAGARSPEADALALDYTSAPSLMWWPTSDELDDFMTDSMPKVAALQLLLSLPPAIAKNNVKPLRNAAALVAVTVALPVALAALWQRAVVAMYRADSELCALEKLRRELGEPMH